MSMIERHVRNAVMIAAVITSVGFSSAIAAPKDPSGTYLTEDSRGRIRLEKCGAQLTRICGYLVWMMTPLTDAGKPKIDSRNPDPAKKQRALLGHQLLMGLGPFKDESYQGLVYNNEDGKSYNVTIWLENDVLKVQGCLVAFLCKTETWMRANDILPGQLDGPTGSATGPQPDAEWKAILPTGDQSQASAASAKPVAKAKPKP